MLSRFFLFYLITTITGSPLFALCVILALYVALDYQFTGIIRRGMGIFQMETEIAQLKRDIALNPHNAAAMNDIGRLLVMRGREGAALVYFEKAYERLSDLAETNYYLGLAYMGTGNEGMGEAKIKKALEINPKTRYGEPALRLAEYYAKNGRVNEARALFDQFFSIHSSSPEGHYKFGLLQNRMGDRASAIEHFSKAIEVSHLSPSFKRREERLWVMKARYQRAKTQWGGSS